MAGIALLGGDSSGGSGSKKRPRPGSAAGRSHAAADSGGTTSSPPAPSGAAAPASEAAPSSSGDGASLNAQGFELISEGRAEEAVPILRQAVDSFPEGSTDLNYAYALYNLGNALRLSGHPEEAIPFLEQRLRIPNQRSTVAAELARARAEAQSG